MRFLIEAAVKGDLKEIEDIVCKHPGEINKKGKFGKTALHYVTYLGFSNATDLLLEQPRLQVNVKDDNGMTPLMLAAMEGNANIVKRLLDHPHMNVNEKTIYKVTALMYAAKNGHKEVVDQLLHQPFIHVNDFDHNGLTALNYAWVKGHAEICALLKPFTEIGQTYYIMIQLLNAAKNGDDYYIDKFINGYNYHRPVDMDKLINQGDSAGFTPLHVAAVKGNAYIVHRLLQHPEIDVNRTEAKHGRTALMYAAACGHLTIVEVLLSHPGVKVNQVDSDGRTATTLACHTGKTEVARYLLAAQGRLDSNFLNNM